MEDGENHNSSEAAFKFPFETKGYQANLNQVSDILGNTIERQLQQR